MKTYQDFCQNITRQLFNLIDAKGSLLNWHKTWDSKGCALLPLGANGAYHGANVFNLLFNQFDKGFQSNQWLTFNQVRQKGGQVKKGAKCHKVFFWSLRNVEEAAEGNQADDAEGETKQKAIFKVYSVFNLEQTTLDASSTSQNNTLSVADIDDFVKKLNVEISHYGNSAFYNRSQDAIVLPKPELFHSEANYYATLLHELAHWSGSENRLARPTLIDYGKSDAIRAKEELIAEICSVFLSIHFGLKAELENHAAYIQDWKTSLTEKDVLQASHKAMQAFEWLIKQGGNQK